MKNNINEEIQGMKFLFHYKPGVILSEQFEDEEFEDFEDEEFEGDEVEDEEFDFDTFDTEMGENREIQIPVRPDVDTPTKPKKPGTPYSPKPGPKKNPKAEKGDMPDWLSFDELGIDFE
jgi:hypothetical protein